jgi:hypothetical protein
VAGGDLAGERQVPRLELELTLQRGDLGVESLQA